jgi:uncharacterized protein
MAHTPHGECKLLRVFCDSSARWHGQPKAEAILEAARKAGLAGATLFDGIEGFRKGGPLISGKTGLWSLAKPRECLVEIVDEESKMDSFLAASKDILKGAVATVERAFIPNLEDF